MELDFSQHIVAKTLNKPFRTPKGPKKFSVYVKNEKGNIVKVNFGDPNMEIKRDDPNRRKNFRARHNCDNPGPKTKARYWSCKMWSKKSVTQVTKGSHPDWDGETLFNENELLTLNPELAFVEEEVNDPEEDDCGCGGCGCKSEAETVDNDYEMSFEEAVEMLDVEEALASRPGPKSGAQTPAKPSERKKGSSKNKPGSAAKKGSKIVFSDKVINSLKEKVKTHNSKHSKKVTLGQLKKVYRRGAGAFSSSHRPGMSRGGWAMARVNMFLKMKRGGKVKDSYRKADGDI
jgi:hypothetical protein